METFVHYCNNFTDCFIDCFQQVVTRNSSRWNKTRMVLCFWIISRYNSRCEFWFLPMVLLQISFVQRLSLFLYCFVSLWILTACRSLLRWKNYLKNLVDLQTLVVFVHSSRPIIRCHFYFITLLTVSSRKIFRKHSLFLTEKLFESFWKCNLLQIYKTSLNVFRNHRLAFPINFSKYSYFWSFGKVQNSSRKSEILSFLNFIFPDYKLD